MMKTIRGLKKKLKRIDRWKNNHLNIDIEHLNKFNKDYVKIWIDPFYRLERRTPPVKFNRVILSGMINIYNQWNNYLETRNEPYYLKIWLSDPTFIDSQVVAAINNEIEYYNNLLYKADYIKEFPYEKYKITGYNLHEFNWELYVNGYHIYESDIESEKDLAKYINNAYRTETYTIQGGEERCFFIKTGDMWVGSVQNNVR